MKRLFFRILMTAMTFTLTAKSSILLAEESPVCEGDPMTREEALQRLDAAGTKKLKIGTAHAGTYYKASQYYYPSSYTYPIWLVVDDYGNPFFEVFSAYSYKLPEVNGKYSKNIHLYLPSRNGSYDFDGYLKSDCLLLTAEGINKNEEVVMYGRLDN